MFMSPMVKIFSWGERWMVPFNKAKWMVHFIFHWMKTFVPLHKPEDTIFYTACTHLFSFSCIVVFFMCLSTNCFWSLAQYKYHVVVVVVIKFLNKFKRKPLKNDLSSGKTFTSHTSNLVRKYAENCADTCSMLNPRT